MIAKMCFILLTSSNSTDKMLISVNSITNIYKSNVIKETIVSSGPKDFLSVKESVIEIRNILINTPYDKFVCVK